MGLTIKNWPYPKGVKAMLLRISNPIYDGQGNWHSDVTFRSIYKEYKTVPLAWGWLPILKTGLIFCNGSLVDQIRNEPQKNFEFRNAQFDFFVHEFTSDNVLVKLPCFRTTQNGITYNITAIEVVRSFFARTRTLAYEILQENSLIRLCQCRLNKKLKKSVTIQFAPECPAQLCSEKWLPILAWMSIDKQAKLSWASFFHYYRSYPNDVNKMEIPLFPLAGYFSLDCYHRSYGKNVWFDEIINIHCDTFLHFDEVLASKYVTAKKYDDNDKHKSSRFISTSKASNIRIVNTETASLNSSVTLETDLPGFVFETRPKIHITEKVLEISKSYAFGIEEKLVDIEVTGKNIGFTSCVKGVEFKENEQDESVKTKQLDISFTLNLKQAYEKDLVYNTTLLKHLNDMKLLNKMSNILGMKTNLYELPANSTFSWIAPNIKRCIAISLVYMNTGKKTFIVEVDRTIFGDSLTTWHIALLLINFRSGGNEYLLENLINTLSKSGHWGELKLNNFKDYFIYKRIKHFHDTQKDTWISKIACALTKL